MVYRWAFGVGHFFGRRGGFLGCRFSESRDDVEAKGRVYLMFGMKLELSQFYRSFKLCSGRF